MRNFLLLLTCGIVALSVSCGGATTNVAVKPANTNANANQKAPTPAATSNANAEKTETASNPELDFTIVNKTGYNIKEVLVGPSATKEWSDDMEILKGRNFADGANLDVKFHPNTTAAKWDVKVEWADGSGSEEWLNLDLTKIEKVTLKYDKASDKTTAEIE